MSGPFNISPLLSLLLISIFSRLIDTFHVPCSQKLIGSPCLFDEECYGMNSVCRKGRCTCPTNFEEFNIDAEKRICRLAPSKIGDTCQRDCKPPLLCRDGRCECYGGSIVNDECVVPCPAGQQLYGVECTRVAKYGQPCAEDGHCVDPFNACISGTCQCSPGTTRNVMGGYCYAVCPDGMHPHQTCRRLFINDIDMLENAASTDSCPLGYRCVTYGSPYVGHCCRLRCPYGEPDLGQSCDAGAPLDSKCRPLTHFCYTITEPGWKSSLCCPRPCRDPTPLYINGQCHSIAHRDDPCHIDEQCEGGVTMGCVLGTCKCKLGYHEYNDERFPTCARDCALTIGEVASSDRCLQKSALNHRCYSNRQCPLNSECRFGTCQCRCGYVLAKSLVGDANGVCQNPTDPAGIDSVIRTITELFNNNKNQRTSR